MPESPAAGAVESEPDLSSAVAEPASGPAETAEPADSADQRRHRQARRITAAWTGAAVVVFLIGAALAAAFCFRM